MGRVDEQNISNALTIGRHPEQAVEFLIAGGGERVRTVEIDRLTREQMDRLAGLICDFVVWQMGWKQSVGTLLSRPSLSRSRNAVIGTMSLVPLTTAGRRP